jgi:hypothetical protein
MHFIFILIHYLPFWAVPILLLSIEFALIYHLKGLRFPMLLCSLMGTVCFVLLVIYFMSGSPDEATRLLQLILEDLKNRH